MNIRMRVGMGSIVLMLGGLLLAGCGSMGQSAAVIDLSGVTQNWDKVIPAAQRFVVLPAFNNDAVRDNETGLVWEQSPSTATNDWTNARFMCHRTTGAAKAGACPRCTSWPVWSIRPSQHRARPSRLAIPLPTSSRPTIGRRRRPQTFQRARGSCSSAVATCSPPLRPAASTPGVFVGA